MIKDGKLLIIDHGHALGGVNSCAERTNRLKDPVASGFFTDGPLTKAFAQHIRVLNGSNPFKRIVNKINQIPYAEILNIVKEAASYWNINDIETKQVADFLEIRKPQLQGFITYLVTTVEYFVNYGGEQLSWI